MEVAASADARVRLAPRREVGWHSCQGYLWG